MHTASASPSTAELVTRYAASFDAAVGASGHTVSSPLGAWLLVSLAAPLSTGDERAAIEDVLGTDADDAHARAVELLAHPHDAVAHAVAVWHRADYVRPAFVEWSRRLDAAVATGPVPDQRQADRWARDHTLGLIDRFPLEFDDLTAIVLTSALVTKVRWSTPFEVTSSQWFSGTSQPPPDDGRSRAVSKALLTPPEGHDVGVFATERAGEVAVHAVVSDHGLLVVSVIGDPAVTRAEVRAAAHDVATTLARAAPVAGPAVRVAIADLPLGRGHAWDLWEYPVDIRKPVEAAEAVLPAWAVTDQHDLEQLDAPGIGPALAALAALTDDAPGPPRVSAAQAVSARFDEEGFEAAAVTDLSSAARGMVMPEHTHTQRFLEVQFDRPYAVVAVARDPATTRDTGTPHQSVWHGMPVFSAFVEEPADAGWPG